MDGFEVHEGDARSFRRSPARVERDKRSPILQHVGAFQGGDGPPGGEAPVVDPYVANIIALLREAGFAPSERLVKAEEAMARALAFELLAALGPTCWLAFVNIMAGGAVASARMRKVAARPDKPAAVLASSMPETADDLDRCLADLFEAEPAGVMTAKDIRPLVQAWFATKGLKLNEAALWPRMGQRFKRDPNGGRPRYLGLKARVKGPPKLAVVSAA